MSSRGSIALGSDLLAETAQLIPVAWLAFLDEDLYLQLADFNEPLRGEINISRKAALGNFESNLPFFSEITDGSLDFALAQRLVEPIRASRARSFKMGISDLLPDEDDRNLVLPTLKALAEKDAHQAWAWGQMRLESTAEMMYALCWITPRWLEHATKQEKESMVTGHISA